LLTFEIHFLHVLKTLGSLLLLKSLKGLLHLHLIQVLNTSSMSIPWLYLGTLSTLGLFLLISFNVFSCFYNLGIN
jgi:hypothetical protein